MNKLMGNINFTWQTNWTVKIKRERRRKKIKSHKLQITRLTNINFRKIVNSIGKTVWKKYTIIFLLSVKKYDKFKDTFLAFLKCNYIGIVDKLLINSYCGRVISNSNKSANYTGSFIPIFPLPWEKWLNTCYRTWYQRNGRSFFADFLLSNENLSINNPPKFCLYSIKDP